MPLGLWQLTATINDLKKGYLGVFERYPYFLFSSHFVGLFETRFKRECFRNDSPYLHPLYLPF